MDLYYTENQYLGGGHPITKGASNFHFDDEIYYDMDIKPEVRVLATSYTPNVREGRKPAEGGKAHIYDIQPQMWAYEKTAEGGTQPYRAFVSIPGHLYDTFDRPNYRAILLRGIAWAGKRANLDEFCKPEELSALTYPDGGPQKPGGHARESRNPSRLQAHARRRRAAHHQADEFRLGARRPPVGRRDARSIRMAGAACARIIAARSGKITAASTPTPGEQDRKAIDKISRLTDTERRRRDGQEGGLLRRPRSRHRPRLPQGRRDRHAGAGHPLAARHERRRQGRQSGETLHRPRHRRHARGHQQPALGLGRLDLRHARLQRLGQSA